VRDFGPQADLFPFLLRAAPRVARLPRLLNCEAAGNVGRTTTEVCANGYGLIFSGLDSASVGVATFEFVLLVVREAL
jgi:hypothetical protein